MKKELYYIILNGKPVGKTYAVSPEKACNNYWWVNCKNRNPYAYTEKKPSDFDAVRS